MEEMNLSQMSLTRARDKQDKCPEVSQMSLSVRTFKNYKGPDLSLYDLSDAPRVIRDICDRFLAAPRYKDSDYFVGVNYLGYRDWPILLRDPVAIVLVTTETSARKAFGQAHVISKLLRCRQVDLRKAGDASQC